MKKFVFTNSKKIFNRVLAIALAVSMVIALVTAVFVVDSLAIANPKCYHKFFLSTFNGSYDAENMPSTYWEVKPLEVDGNKLSVSAKVELSITNRSQRSLGQVWVNISDFNSDKLEIFSYYGTSNKALNLDKTPYVITKNDVINSEDGWFKVYDFQDTKNFVKAPVYTEDYLISFSTNLRVREMVFIDTEFELIDDIDSIDEYFEGFPNNDNNNPINFAVDESRYFDMKKVKA